MKPTEQLKAEHEGIKLMLKILDSVCDKLKSTQELNQDHFTKILEFLKIFVDKCHHGKEEDLLLPAMVKAGVPKDKGAIEFTLMEHKEGRGYVKSMSEAFDKLKRGDSMASKKIVENEKYYIDLLIKHIDKEENILYPMANKVLSQAKQGELDEEFEKLEVDRIGLGKHEEFHKLLQQLKEIYLD
jgi:hemerythrin-like domain-containing protein